MRKGPVLTSLAIHLSVMALALLLASIPAVRNNLLRSPDRVVPLLAPRRLIQTKAQGGGGQRNALPASRGAAPPRPVARIYVAPMAVRIQDPKLRVQQALIDAPEISSTAQIGDPLGRIGVLSGGPGGPSGIGDGIGIGSGRGPGNGNGGSSYKALGITEQPKLLHSEEPEYSEEARKARSQGSVLLAIDVDVNGHVANVRVMKSLGFGLDEKAKEAVLKWRFRPAMASGHPVTAPAQVTVTFHLL